jgi:hypothetical protein
VYDAKVTRSIVVVGFALLFVVGCSDPDDAAGGSPAGAGPGATGGGASSSVGGAGGSGGSGGSATGDRYVAVDGADRGDCSVDPCRTFAYAGSQMQPGEILVIKDGSYPDAIDPTTFPSGSAEDYTVVRSEHDDETTITGTFALHQNADLFLEFRGLRFEGPDTKEVAAGSVRFSRVAFVGGPPDGNTVSFVVGTSDFQPGAWNVECEDCIFHGLGGRYAALVYRGDDVSLTRAVARKDGGWGLEEEDTESEPEGVIVFYETTNSSCSECVAFDSLKLSDASAEGLGSLIQNSHTSDHTNVAFTGCFAVANDYSGFSFEGNGSVGEASLSDCTSSQNAGNGITANVDGTIVLTRVSSLDNEGTGVASYGDASVTMSDSQVAGNGGGALDGVSGSTTGAGAGSVDLGAFDSARLRRELCERPGVTRGWCAGSLSFQDYLTSFR